MSNLWLAIFTYAYSTPPTKNTRKREEKGPVKKTRIEEYTPKKQDSQDLKTFCINK
jgi:hypothetical protein